MEHEGIIKKESKLNYNYATIKITQSRIDKGLIAIPVSLASRFPNHNTYINVILDNGGPQQKHYSSYTESARENRIEGLTKWFNQNDIKTGDEIVIQFIDKENFIYRLIPERDFIHKTLELQGSFDSSEDEKEASQNVNSLSDWTRESRNEVIFSEYYRLINTPVTDERLYVRRNANRTRENVPVNIRTLLRSIYNGHCQVCDFWFLKQDKEPYFEIHHIDPNKSHHPQNLIVVCGNCHNQFEHANVMTEFNDRNWLTQEFL